MDEIIKLANAYNLIKENWFVVDDGWWEYLEYDEEKEPMLIYKNSWTYASWEDAVAILISNSYGFIEWLCKEDKIWDNEKSDRHTMMRLMRAEAKEQQIFEWIEYYEWVIMMLSIQDDPLRFLSSIIRKDV